MNTEERIMRCQIEGSWTAKDMAESLFAFRDLYNLRLGLQVLIEDHRNIEGILEEMWHYPPFRHRIRGRRVHPLVLEALIAGTVSFRPDVASIGQLIYPHEELKVRKIEYASPGFKDLAGLGEIVGHVKDMALRLIEHFSSRRARELRDDEQELKNQALRLQNAKSFVELGRDLGFEDTELRKLVLTVDSKQEPLVKLIQSGKLQGVRMLDEPDTPQQQTPPQK